VEDIEHNRVQRKNETPSKTHKQLNLEMKQQQLEWRRSKVLELSSEGYSQMEIAKQLHVDLAAVIRSIIQIELIEK
jgi:DNA-binding NarL/FixJ family response regulator